MSRKTHPLTSATVRDLFDYNPATGDLIWRIDRTGGTKAGDVAGSISATTGYRRIKVGGVAYQAALLVWLWHHGSFPINEIDHEDRDPLNNRIENLRDVARAVNLANRSSWKKTVGLKGVRRHRNRFVAEITVDRETVFIGSYLTPEEAAQAFKRAHVERYGIDSEFFDQIHRPNPALIEFAAQAIERRRAQLRVRPPMDGLEQIRRLSGIRYTQREHLNMDEEMFA